MSVATQGICAMAYHVETGNLKVVNVSVDHWLSKQNNIMSIHNLLHGEVLLGVVGALLLDK